MSDLKKHKFFEDINFDTLLTDPSPINIDVEQLIEEDSDDEMLN